QLVPESRPPRISGIGIAARDLHVDHRRQPEVQNLTDDICGLEVALYVWIVSREHLANLVLVDRGRAMARLELNQDIGILRGDAVGLIESEVIGDRQTDVVADALQLVGRDHRPNPALDVVVDLLAALDTRTGWGTNVKTHHARVDARKEILADDRVQWNRGENHQRDRDQSDRAMIYESREHADVAVPHAHEARPERT